MTAKEDAIEKYNVFSQLCLTNAEASIGTAESLLGKNVNHIAFHLVVIGLEEIGKIFIGWNQLFPEEEWDEEKVNIPMDDHKKKLFWAILGFAFMNEKITEMQITDIRNLASDMHEIRLKTMYTELSDTITLSQKISDELIVFYVNLGKTRLEMAKSETGVSIENIESSSDNINWFMRVSNFPERRNFIFGDAQEKLIELGSVREWINWLKEYYSNKEKESRELVENELRKNSEVNNSPKWKVTFKVITPSHAIKDAIKNFNNKDFKFRKGNDSHTLIIDMFFSKSIPINALWDYGNLTSKLLIASLNIGTNGIFYWNMIVDKTKYYDKIRDLEIDKELKAELVAPQVNWGEKKMVIEDKDLYLTLMTFKYFCSIYGTPEFELIHEYSTALAMFSKSDIHLNFEIDVFYKFYNVFKKAYDNNDGLVGELNLLEGSYIQLEKLITNKLDFHRVISLGIEMETTSNNLNKPISIAEILAIKSYCNMYLLTLAARMQRNDKSLKLALDKN